MTSDPKIIFREPIAYDVALMLNERTVQLRQIFLEEDFELMAYSITVLY